MMFSIVTVLSLLSPNMFVKLGMYVPLSFLHSSKPLSLQIVDLKDLEWRRSSAG